MKTKAIIFIIFVFTFFYKASAQYSIAGSTIGIYTDIPDTLICYIPSYSLSLDINQDGINDVNILSHAMGYPIASGWGVIMYSYAFSLNNDLSLCLWKTVCPGKLLMPFNMGDTISRSTYIKGGYMSYTDSHSSCGNIEWMDNADHYIGVRYATNIDTAYGWVRVRVNKSSNNYHAVTIKDFALEKNPVVGIKELGAESLKLSVYPNPACDKLNVESIELRKDMEISMYNALGNEVYHSTFNSRLSTIDVSFLPKGIYFVQIKTDKGIGTRKIVVQR